MQAHAGRSAAGAIGSASARRILTSALRGTGLDLSEAATLLDEKLGASRASMAVMDKSRGELVQDVRNMTQQLEHSREKLGRSRTEREANWRAPSV